MAYLDHRPVTPAEALDELLAGNERFVAGTRIHPHQDAEHRAVVAAAQRPFAVVFGCSDSRLAAEIIFDRGLGDLFVVRTAGHIVGAEVTASIEYGVVVLGAPLVVVLGHDSCGAIQATRAVRDGGRLPGRNLGAIVERVTPSVEAAEARRITGDAEVAGVHIGRTVDLVTRPGTALADAVAGGRCDVVGMFYRLADGKVTVTATAATGGGDHRPGE
ncbi:carbonic anhydrase [Plantactinospora sp. WMMC1484]|uniref:carbonic anhydrase n=1 Tax=Plantactinospora sp. WMMC1484 TaxID=3404122 RepID=UPI003BF54989